MVAALQLGDDRRQIPQRHKTEITWTGGLELHPLDQEFVIEANARPAIANDLHRFDFDTIHCSQPHLLNLNGSILSVIYHDIGPPTC
jgi:hypothetical protein